MAEQNRFRIEGLVGKPVRAAMARLRENGWAPVEGGDKDQILVSMEGKCVALHVQASEKAVGGMTVIRVHEFQKKVQRAVARIQKTVRL